MFLWAKLSEDVPYEWTSLVRHYLTLRWGGSDAHRWSHTSVTLSVRFYA